LIVSRTPYRISFFGGGTDYPAWYRKHGGAVLTCTFDSYCYVTCRFLPPFFEHKNRIVWSKIELTNSIDEIEMPVVAAALKYLNVRNGVEIHHIGDLPARSGLGSSSSFAVGVLNALRRMEGQDSGAMELAKDAIYLEQKLMQESVGIQDQIQTAHGGLNKITFDADDRIEVSPLNLSNERLEEFNDHLMLFYTGVSRNATDIAKHKIANIPNKQDELRAMQEMVDEGVNILEGHGDITEFGKLLDESWKLKRSLSAKIAPEFVNEIYETALKSGAYGGKLLGAGGGGFILFFVDPARRQEILDALEVLLWVPVTIEFEGAKILFDKEPRFSATSHMKREFMRRGFNSHK